MNSVTATELRNNLYTLLDEVLKTGVPLEIKKGKKKLRIVPVESVNIFDKLVARPNVIVGKPEDLVDISWEGEVRLDLP